MTVKHVIFRDILPRFIFLNIVSKTVEELILEWNPEEPISIKGLGMSQFELQKIVPSKCHEEFQIGKLIIGIKEWSNKQ